MVGVPAKSQKERNPHRRSECSDENDGKETRNQEGLPMISNTSLDGLSESSQNSTRAFFNRQTAYQGKTHDKRRENMKAEHEGWKCTDCLSTESHSSETEKEKSGKLICGLTKTHRYAERLCAFYVTRPKTAFAISLSIQVCMLLGTGLLFMLGYNIFPYDFTEVPLYLEEDPTKLHADAFNFVSLDPRIDLLPVTTIAQHERTWRVSPLSFVYKPVNDADNVISKQRLLDIAANENEIYRNKDFRQICHRNSFTGNCSAPMSVIRLFDGTFRTLNPLFYDPDFNRIDEVFSLAFNYSQTRPLVSYNMDKQAKFVSGKIQATCLRSLMFSGIPLHGYRHSEDRKDEQLNLVKSSVVAAFGKTLFHKYKSGVGDMKFYYLNMELFYDAVERQVIWDLMLAVGSLIFIFSYLWFQTGSLWITCWAVFSILTNFFGANLIYRVVLDFRFIGIFHALSVFIILGIGSDDVFIFYNTWKLMEAKRFPSLITHLTETFRLATGSMFVTSLTTAVAFLASASSPLLGVSSFGVFSGILVIVNFISVCVFFPSVVVTYHLFWKDTRTCCCCYLSVAKKQSLLGNSNSAHDAESAPQDDMTRMFKAIVKWFETSYADTIVLHKQVRLILLAIFVIMSAIFLAYAMQLSPDDEMPQVWPEGSNWHDIRYISRDHFQETGEGTNVIRVYVVWGLKPQDRSKCHFTDFKCKGDTVLDEDFDLNNPQCQTAILNFCRKLKGLSPENARRLRIRRNVATKNLEVSCFIDEMDRYVREHTNLNLTFPITLQKTKLLMEANPHIYNVSQVGQDYRHFFETTLGFWLSHGGHPERNFEYYKYASYMGGTLDKTSAMPPNVLSLAQGGRRGNRLRYVAVVVNTSLTGETMKKQDGEAVYKSWEDFIKQETANMPKQCAHAFQCTPEWNNWHWLKVQGELLHGARTGIVIGLCLAFPVLVFTTCNWIIGLIATITISLITLGVVGLIPLVGWRLGVTESLNLTLVVGLAVDYAVHLADGYVQSPHYKREDRVRYMLGHVGVSVLAGAATTLGSATFMLGARILFFFQFGVFIFCTIGFSIVYALVLFTIIVGMFGPEGDSGSLHSLYRMIRRKICWRKGEDEDTEQLQSTSESLLAYRTTRLESPAEIALPNSPFNKEPHEVDQMTSC